MSYAKPKCCKQMIREVQQLNQERDQQIKLRDEVIQNDYLSLIALKTSTNVYKFDDLNDDVILHIFKYLDNIADKTILELGISPFFFSLLERKQIRESFRTTIFII